MSILQDIVDPPMFFGGSERPQDTSNRPIERSLRCALLATDAVCIGVVWLVIAMTDFEPDRLFVAAIASFVAVLWLVGHSMYYSTGKERASQTAHLYEAAVLAAVAANVADSHLGVRLGAGVLAIGAVLGGFALHGGRIAYRSRLERAQRQGRHLRKTVIVGPADESAGLARRLHDAPELGYSVAATVAPADLDQVAALTRASGGETVLVVLDALAAPDLARIVRETTNAGLHVHLMGATTGIDPRRVQSRSFGREASLHIHPVALNGWQAAVKRVFDLVVASTVLLLTLPVVAICAVLVKLSDGGPALFRQERVGRDGQPFVMYKLRSMVVDAESRLDEVSELNQRSGPLFKLSADPRVTRIGRLLRAASLDELPQLFNVIKGDMSLVGPRPALAREVESFGANLRRRESVLPGITGLWQIEGRDDPDFAVYEEADLFYVENWSVGLDVVILLKTFAALTRRIARKLTRRLETREIVLD